ncbi:MAG: hypothetical protein OJJ21_17680 [Ferrovibrio sp.]|nr:hypothetical protein [Ferrovibrio sp.]MCW0235434.1 hypothetical protein [Ferrovibrio sp.]
MNMKLWGMPILLGLLSGIGLIAALLDDGLWAGLAWLALGFPTVFLAG